MEKNVFCCEGYKCPIREKKLKSVPDGLWKKKSIF
jgi:hypothetical protein